MDRRLSSIRCRILMLLAGGLLLLTGCQSRGAGTGGFADQATNGRALYAQNCAGCHGTDGRQGVAPALNDPLFLQLVSDSDLHNIVDRGRADSLMPAFGTDRSGTLSSTQIDAIVRAIREQWQPKGPTPAPATLPSYAQADAPTGNTAPGAALYATNCATCHGDKGNGGSGGRIDNPALLQLTSDQELRRIIITGIPARGMPAYNQYGANPLTSQEIADIVAFLGGLRHAGSATPAPAR